MARIIITQTVPLFYIFISLFSHQAMSQPEHLHTFCILSNNVTQTSSYEANRDTLLSSLRERSSLGTYSNATIGLSFDTVYGMFFCSGDITSTSCTNCVRTATIDIDCNLNKISIIYYDECMVRYSNVSFFTESDLIPGYVIYSLRSSPNSNRFNQTLSDKFNQMILSVSSSSSSSLIPYFLEDQGRVTQSEGSYELESMIQCSLDLNQFNCTVCLRIALFRVSTCCGLPSFAQIFTPKCLLRYKTSILLSSPSSPSSPPPLTQPPPSFSHTPQQPPPPHFTRPPNVPSPSGSFAINIVKEKQIFGRVVVTMTALGFVLVDM